MRVALALAAALFISPAYAQSDMRATMGRMITPGEVPSGGGGGGAIVNTACSSPPGGLTPNYSQPTNTAYTKR